MGFTPIAAGDASGIHNSFTVDGGGIFSLIGVAPTAMQMHWLNVATGNLRVGDGTWSITNAQNGKADYFPSVTDVGTAGTFTIYPVIFLPTGPKAFDEQVLQILSMP